MEGKEFQFDYQKLIEDNKLDVGELPDTLQQMIHMVNSHYKLALEKCTDGHCKLVKDELSPYAEFILDELYDHYSDRIKGNQLEEVVEEREPTDEEIIKSFIESGRKWVHLADLAEAGFKGGIDGRYAKAGDYLLMKERFEDRWHILHQSKLNK